MNCILDGYRNVKFSSKSQATTGISWIRSPHRIATLFVLLFIFTGLSACAGLAESLRPDSAGWRIGWVSRIAAGKDLNNIAIRECVAPLPPEEILRGRFAVINYPEGRARRYRTVSIPDSLTLEVGDAVRINIRDCALPISRSE